MERVYKIIIIYVPSFTYDWIFNNISLGSNIVFLTIIYMCFNIALITAINKSVHYIQVLSFATFIMFGGIIFAVIVAITDGDALIFADTTGLETTKNKTI